MTATPIASLASHDLRRPPPRPPAAPDDPRDLLQLLRGAEAQTVAELRCPPLVLRVREGSTVQSEGTPAVSIHIVRSGAFKCVRVLEDGYEQVVSLAERGDVMGFDGLCDGVHQTTAVALEDSTVYTLSAGDLQYLPMEAPRIAQALHAAVSRNLVDAGRTADMMAAIGAETRLARFLLWYADRALARGESGRRMHLRMARRDIASLLGMAHETVSRGFTTLAREGVLAVDNREIEIHDRDGLLAHSRGTRRGGDAGARRPGGTGSRG